MSIGDRQAFARPVSTDEHDSPCSVTVPQDGMTYRQYLIGQAITNPDLTHYGSEQYVIDVVDGVIAALDKEATVFAKLDAEGDG